MPHFLTQAAYTTDAWSALVKHPVNRIEHLRPLIEKAGGKLIAGFMSFGDYDVVLITEAPSNVDAAALAIAAAAGGSVRAIKTTPLLTVEEIAKALEKAPNLGYRAVSAGA
jgi:uncharacterized protein with GYD domain